MDKNHPDFYGWLGCRRVVSNAKICSRQIFEEMRHLSDFIF